MGSSKSHRSGPSWQSNNTGRGKESYSKGYRQVPYEGTIMSGEDQRTKIPAKARNKSSSSRSSVKNSGPYGQS